ncbi:hypothetical protein H2200_007800 [Cladophialophora chaetospira]|uniref:N-acetyltransferase domain-containing protein n=1 Tax=Cladophialophora chaetospira TaxID=386627 RepID=A0AA39CGT7_9EURO|nr:hypothetical protein H2200_007800 [Cladophialophora chaetospira]
MTLHIHQLDPSNPNDHLYFPTIARVHLAAWLTVPLMKAIYYGPPDAYPGYLASMEQRHTKAFREESDCRFAVVLDDAFPPDDEVVFGWTTTSESNSPPRGKVIAAIKYYFVNTGPYAPSFDATTEEPTTSSSKDTRSWPPQSHEALASDFWSQLVRAREMLTSKLGDHVLVDNLYTDPNHHRRGAGGLLMRHACNEADAQGLPSMLEASPKGIGVYQSVGYEAWGEGGDDGQGVIWVDLERWAGAQDRGVEFTEERIRRDPERKGEGWYAQVLMVRLARRE